MQYVRKRRGKKEGASGGRESACHKRPLAMLKYKRMDDIWCALRWKEVIPFTWTLKTYNWQRPVFLLTARLIDCLLTCLTHDEKWLLHCGVESERTHSCWCSSPHPLHSQIHRTLSRCTQHFVVWTLNSFCHSSMAEQRSFFFQGTLVIR